jgi:hypothetical protein
MPRRRVLTEPQLETLLALPTDDAILVQAFGFLYFGPGYRRDILTWQLPVALATTSAVSIAATLMDELRRRRLIVPGPFVIEQLAVASMAQAERHIAHQLTHNLSRGPGRWMHCCKPRKPRR